MFLNLLNLQLLTNYNVLNNNNILNNQTVELLSSSFVAVTLTGLIILSLILTFYSKGTAVHKVLGLLLVSIFVVFL